jgi:predicted transcriptional regulator
MPSSNKPRKIVRRSISLSRELDRKVQSLARHKNFSANRILEELIATGLEAKEAERRRFFDLAERLTTLDNADEIEQVKRELARMTFGG